MRGDLVVLAADKDIEQALRGILSRAESLAIRPLSRCEFIRHPQHDPGVWKNGPDLISGFASECDRALVVLDKDWVGSPGECAVIEGDLEKRLRPVWEDRARVVCIDPEVEIWIWSESPEVAGELGWESFAELRSRL